MIKIPDIPVSSLLKIAGGQSAPFQNGLLSSIPPGLLNAPAGSLVNALVTGAGQGGNFTLKTPTGLLSIQTTLPLQQGNTLDFQVLNPGKDFQLLLVALNAQPVKKTNSNPAENKKADEKGGTQFHNITEEELLFTVTPYTKQQSHPQPQIETAPAVTTDTSNLQKGQMLQATLVLPQENAADTLFSLITSPNVIHPNIPNLPTIGETTQTLTSVIKPGAVFSFRIIELALPAINTLQQSPATQPQTDTMVPLTAPSPSNPSTANPAASISADVIPDGSPSNTVAPGVTSSTPHTNPVTPQTDATVTPPPTTSSQDAAPIPKTPPSTATFNVGEALNIHTATPLPAMMTKEVAPSQSPTAILNPTIPNALLTHSTQLPIVAATVLGTEKSGDTVVKTSFGTLALDLHAILPKNTQLYLELTAITPAKGLTPSFPAQVPSDSIPQLIKYWASLDASTHIIRQANPALADKLPEILPAPDKNLGAKLVHFIQALQSGSISEWLGQAFIKTLQQEKKTEIYSQLLKDFTALRNAFIETANNPQQPWQTLIIPIFSEGALHQARMYIRNMRDQGKNNKHQNSDKGADARFVVEVDLEKLGSLQFDGLVKKVDNGKFFDLIIRSHQVLDPSISRDILEIFATTQEISGLKGKISFQTLEKFPVNPAQELFTSVEDSNHSIVV